MVASLISDAVVIMALLSVLPMGAIALAAGVVSLIQAATQIQEQSIIHLARLVVLGAVVAVGGEWAAGSVVELFERVVSTLARGGV